VMIETREGIEKVEEIVATPGLGGVYIGPSDLAYALGLPPLGDTEDANHLATVEKILAGCKKHKGPAGIHTGGPEWTKRRLATGFDFVTLGSDVGFMSRLAATELATAKGAAKKESERTGY